MSQKAQVVSRYVFLKPIAISLHIAVANEKLNNCLEVIIRNFDQQQATTQKLENHNQSLIKYRICPVKINIGGVLYKKLSECEGIFEVQYLKAYILQSVQDRKFPIKYLMKTATNSLS